MDASDFSPTATFGAERRELRLEQGLPLTIHHPPGESRGTVLLVPGWSGPRTGPADILVFLAAKLSAAGWTAVRFDLPGRGDAPGEFADCDLDAMIAACCAVRKQSAREKPAVLLGMCSGGNVSLGAACLADAELNPPPAPRVIALSTLPFQPARTKSFEQQRRWKNIKQYAAKAVSPDTWVRLIKGDINLQRVKKNVTASEKPGGGERNLKDSARDIEKELNSWSAPALFIWGGGDEEAALSRTHFEKLHAGGMGAPGGTQFHTIEGANHNFYSRAWREQLSAKIVEFLAKA